MLLAILKGNKLLKRLKVINRKGDKLYAKWKCYNSSFNSCFDKKGIA